MMIISAMIEIVLIDIVVMNSQANLLLCLDTRYFMYLSLVANVLFMACKLSDCNCDMLFSVSTEFLKLLKLSAIWTSVSDDADS